MCNESSNPILTNCTMTSNTALLSGGALYSRDSSPTMTNCILWGNSPDEIYGKEATLTYSNIQGGPVDETNHNIDLDPLFADPENGDFHLKSQVGRWDPVSENWIMDDVTSPCIDAGDSSDYSMEPPPNGDRINMGAYGGTEEASKSPLDSL